MEVKLDSATRDEIARLRAKGCVVWGPAPVSRTQVMATPDVTETLPGYLIQIGVGHRWIQGFGGTPAGALADARRKLAEIGALP